MAETLMMGFDSQFDMSATRGVSTGGCLGEPGTHRLANYPLRHLQVSWDFNISPEVPCSKILSSFAACMTAFCSNPNFDFLVLHCNFKISNGACAQISSNSKFLTSDSESASQTT